MSTTIYGRIADRKLLTNPKAKTTKTLGINFPMGKDSSKYLAKASGIALVRDHVRQLLLTEQGERLMLPRYGTPLRKYLFENINDDIINGIKEDIRESIARYAKNVTIKKLSILPLDRYSYEDFGGFKIFLSVKVKELEDSVFDLQLEIN